MTRQTWVQVVVVAAGAALAGCGGPTQREFGRADTDALRQLASDFVAAYNGKDAAKLAGQFTGTGALMVPNSSIVRGPEAIQGYYELRLGPQGATDLELRVSEVSGHGTLAYITGTYSFRNAPADGPESRDRGKFMFIAKLMPGGGWRFEILMWSSDLPPPPPPPPAPSAEVK